MSTESLVGSSHVRAMPPSHHENTWSAWECVALAVLAVGGATLLAMNATHFLGPIGSVGSIAGMAMGGGMVAVALTVLAVRVYQNRSQPPVAVQEEPQPSESAAKPITSGPSTDHSMWWWNQGDPKALAKQIMNTWRAMERREGYRLIIKDFSSNYNITLHGKSSTTEALSGPPVHPDNCDYCSTNDPVPSVMDTERCRLITSKSNRPLLIPTQDPIPVHWFQAGSETQEALLEGARVVLDTLHAAYPQEVFYLQLHCGTSAGQTVPHLHLRIECDRGWSGSGKLNWQSHFKQGSGL